MSDIPKSKSISQETLQKIEKKFDELGVNRKCPRCGHPKFIIPVEGYASIVIQPSDLSTLNLQGQHIPSVITLCEKCGFISLHSLVTLGLLPNQGGQNR